MEFLKPSKHAIKLVLESEWSLVITREQLLLLPSKLVFWIKIGSKLKETVLSWKENNSVNLLED